MDLPDCPPGTEDYQDTVFEMPKKPEIVDDTNGTKVNIMFLYIYIYYNYYYDMTFIGTK